MQDNGRIKFSQGMSTMMACENMEIEHGLNKALITADNYTISGDNLSLNKARMAPLARFKAIK
ncbi:META domain protein [compost metagenome]